MNQANDANTSLTPSISLEPAEPMWERVPTTDENGKPLADFILLIPKLNKQDTPYIQNTINTINKVLSSYRSTAVFADLNMKINTLWGHLSPTKVCALKYQLPYEN